MSQFASMHVLSRGCTVCPNLWSSISHFQQTTMPVHCTVSENRIWEMHRPTGNLLSLTMKMTCSNITKCFDTTRSIPKICYNCGDNSSNNLLLAHNRGTLRQLPLLWLLLSSEMSWQVMSNIVQSQSDWYKSNSTLESLPIVRNYQDRDDLCKVASLAWYMALRQGT